MGKSSFQSAKGEKFHDGGITVTAGTTANAKTLAFSGRYSETRVAVSMRVNEVPPGCRFRLGEGRSNSVSL
jgi:hypothetical protein